MAYEILYFTSLGSFRQRWYELFLATHVVLQTAALVLVFFHHHGGRPYVAVALAIFLIDRLVYRMTLKSWTTEATLEVKEDRYTVTVGALLPMKTHSGLTTWSKTGISGGWKATDHVFISIPSLARKHWIQAHPFTIASRAPSRFQLDVHLGLIIRAQDGFSRDLLKYAKRHTTTTVRFDGPYGSQSAARILQNSDLTVIVAGGSGVAVAWPLVWSLIDPRGSVDGEPPAEFTHFKKILFVWVIRQQSHLSWIDSKEMQSLRSADVDLVIPPPTESHGHPDIRGCITDWIMARDAPSTSCPQEVGIVCSGPDGMNRDVRNLASRLISKGHRINVEVEKFGW